LEKRIVPVPGGNGAAVANRGPVGNLRPGCPHQPPVPDGACSGSPCPQNWIHTPAANLVAPMKVPFLSCRPGARNGVRPTSKGMMAARRRATVNHDAGPILQRDRCCFTTVARGRCRKYLGPPISLSSPWIQKDPTPPRAEAVKTLALYSPRLILWSDAFHTLVLGRRKYAPPAPATPASLPHLETHAPVAAAHFKLAACG